MALRLSVSKVISSDNVYVIGYSYQSITQCYDSMQTLEVDPANRHRKLDNMISQGHHDKGIIFSRSEHSKRLYFHKGSDIKTEVTSFVAACQIISNLWTYVVTVKPVDFL